MTGKEGLLCFELLSMQARDQAVRDEMVRQCSSGRLIPRELALQCEFVDRVNTARMREIVDVHGWPGPHLVGDEGAGAALLLVLHADRDTDFQRSCLESLRQSVAANDAPARHLAFLTDRVRIGANLPQIYGTQIRIADGQSTLYEIEDAENVNERRSAVGLPPLSTEMSCPFPAGH